MTEASRHPAMETDQGPLSITPDRQTDHSKPSDGGFPGRWIRSFGKPKVVVRRSPAPAAPVSARSADFSEPAARRVAPPKRERRVSGGKITLVAILIAIAAGVIYESRSSRLQSYVFARTAKRMTFALQPGPAPEQFPALGPYDERLGYARIPAFTRKLSGGPYHIDAQARMSTWMTNLTRFGIFPVYREKSSAGLKILDRTGRPLFDASYPSRVYAAFEDIPPHVVSSLLYVENREILDSTTPYRNPAVEWDRLGKAVFDMGRKQIVSGGGSSGGSTLATQLEKIRHSPEGRTGSVGDKLKQMASASLRAYQQGEDTTTARRQITCDYINSLPLSSFPGYGEVLGLGDGLWVWFEADFVETNRLLGMTDEEVAGRPALRRARAMAFRQVLSLLLAVNRPSFYLQRSRQDLHARAELYLKALGDAGFIPTQVRDDALRLRPTFREKLPEPGPASFAERKATDAIRSGLLNLLDIDTVYELDRLDLTVNATIDHDATRAASQSLRKLASLDYATSAGVVGYQMLPGDALGSVIYSFTLYEVGEGTNLLRVQADNYDRPLNISQGTQLELGSTAKLRTLASYLDVLAQLHAAGAKDPSRIGGQDPLSAWARDWLSQTPGGSLAAMLEAAMTRRYSGNPSEGFFTGGGLQYFGNFDGSDNGRILPLREGFRHSTNLVFIRLMRDVVQYHMWNLPGVTPAIFEDPSHPKRNEFLDRFVKHESRQFLTKFYARYRGLEPGAAIKRLLGRMRPTPYRLAVAYRSARPGASLADFQKALAAVIPANTPIQGGYEKLFEKYGPDKFNLGDRGYLARVHPLELLTVNYLETHPRATLDEIEAFVQPELPDVYRWLRRNRNKHAQDLRIRMMLETEAFAGVHEIWKRHGFPFPTLVPSLATAIGSSGDNPAALADLAGIILNGGVHYPSVRVTKLHFGAGTPLETIASNKPAKPERVMAAEVAAVLKNEMAGVVEFGTARKAFQSVVLEDGRILRVAGKTGTGDNRLESFDEGGRMIKSKVMSRTAAFVFLIGDKYFGTVVAYVPGQQAEGFKFTSALPVQIFRHLTGSMKSVLEPPRKPLSVPTPKQDTPPKPEGQPAIAMVLSPER
jgi:membrane peptidoglycan carboxypeptidase